MKLSHKLYFFIICLSTYTILVVALARKYYSVYGTDISVKGVNHNLNNVHKCDTSYKLVHK